LRSLGGTDSSSREPLSGRKLRERALDLLSRRDHSRSELRSKLLQKGGSADEIEPLLDELEECRYLDDVRFAENFVRYRAGKAWGRIRYRQELLQRGVDSQVVSQVLQAVPELSPESLRDKLQGLIERELQKGKNPDKVLASLVRKGFSAGAVRDALERSGSGVADCPS